MIQLLNIELKFQNANPKLKTSFPNDPQGDLQIIFKKSKFHLQKIILKDESEYFKNLSQQDIRSIQIKEDLDEKAFKKVLSTFYGSTIEVDRAEIDRYYEIVKFLKIQTFYKILRADICKQICSYDIFLLLKIAHKYQDQELFSKCFDQLEKDNYMQLQLNQHQLIHLDFSLFKLVIKGYNYFASNKIQTKQNVYINQTTIIDIIQQYCESHQYDKQKSADLLYQLVNYKSLSSDQFKEIFLSQDINAGKSNSLSRKLSKMQNRSSDQPSLKLSNSLHLSIKKNQTTNKKLKLENIYLKKKNQELEKQVSFLKQQIKHIIKVSSQNQQMQKAMQLNFRNLNNQLKEELKRKQISEKQNKKIINNFQTILEKMHDQLDKKTEQIDKIVKNLCDKQGNTFKEQDFYSSSNKNYMNQVIVSQFLPASFIAKVMGPQSEQTLTEKNSKKKVKSVRSPSPRSPRIQSSQQVFEDDEILQTYLNRICFDQDPTTISKKQLPVLGKFINSEGFVKKQLVLCLRRSRNSAPKGVPINLKNISHLLICISTMQGQKFGFYVSKNEQKMLSTKRASKSYYFNLKDKSKRSIYDTSGWDNAFTTDNYLIFWEGELIIPNNFEHQMFYFNNQVSAIKDSPPKKQIKLKEMNLQCIEIYSITQGQMEMIV